MILGIIILKRRYKTSKYVSVIMITIGIAISTIASAPKQIDIGNSINLSTWIVGIVLLTFALLVSARMGIYQEVLYANYGKHTKEALFYCLDF
ncbi:UDP-xylose and UDP-N-acetylglucosamine transporter-like isoform X1 [Leptotrombidium deliense]|uniref:UDP-xylose and UDP-N-acetylglucosamine transporter-like isoform X1 n=1 Tax=Leptotrombidium deliense TaxID=299467 RepID=A0A443SVQ3_9ACAR|nr:UDP-xylose and UDP-N-acetylglucosamine transporter-like isoform X1 [Leptotrombidium deliense]